MAYEIEREKWHKELCAAHHELVSAMERLHKVSTGLFGAIRHSEDEVKLKPILDGLVIARREIRSGYEAASSMRTELIRQTGCSGECNA